MVRGRQLKDPPATPEFMGADSNTPLVSGADHSLEELRALVTEFCFSLQLDSASIVYGLNNRWRIIANHNSPRAFCSYPNTPSTFPFRIAERLIVSDLAARPSLRDRLARTSLKLELHKWRALLRIPFPVGPQEWFAVTGHARTPKAQFPEDGLALLKSLEVKIAHICRALLPQLRKFGDKPGYPLTRDELVAYVESSNQAVSLCDDNMRMITGSPAIRMIFGKDVAELRGNCIGKFAGGFAEPIIHLFKNAIETGFTSPDHRNQSV